MFNFNIQVSKLTILYIICNIYGGRTSRHRLVSKSTFRPGGRKTGLLTSFLIAYIAETLNSPT